MGGTACLCSAMLRTAARRRPPRVLPHARLALVRPAHPDGATLGALLAFLRGGPLSAHVVGVFVGSACLHHHNPRTDLSRTPRSARRSR